MEHTNSRRDILVGIIITTLVVGGLVVYVLQANQSDDASRSSQNQSDTTTGSTDPASEAAPTPSDRVAITFTNDGFEPRDINVKKGTIVTITNNASRNVQFSSNDHPAHRENTEMNLKSLSPGESDSYTATETGTWGFHDHLDESKTGTVTVTN